MKKTIALFILSACLFLLPLSHATTISFTIGNLSPWAKEGVSEAIQQGLIEDNTLLEDAKALITREEFCQTVVTLYEKITYDVSSGESLTNPFTDTTNPDIIRAYDLGIVKGRGDGTFGPKEPIRREEMAVMIDNVITRLEIPFEEAYEPLTVADQEDMASWSIEAIKFVNHNKFMTGDGTNFNPKNDITIEESVIILNRVFKEAVERTSDNALEAQYYEELADQVVILTNLEREKEGLSPLLVYNPLKIVAMDKANDMVDNNYFSHTSPTYGSPFDMMNTYNISYKAAGENIAYGQSSAEEVVTGWMNSPGHRANILNDNFTHIAIGVAENENRQLYFVQMFLKPSN